MHEQMSRSAVKDQELSSLHFRVERHLRGGGGVGDEMESVSGPSRPITGPCSTKTCQRAYWPFADCEFERLNSSRFRERPQTTHVKGKKTFPTATIFWADFSLYHEAPRIEIGISNLQEMEGQQSFSFCGRKMDPTWNLSRGNH